MTRRLVTLAVAGLMTSSSIAWAQTAATTKARSAKAPARKGATAVPPVTEVKLGALKTQGAPAPQASRNPFRFYEPPPPPPAPRQTRPGAQQAPAFVAPPVPQGPPPPPPITLRFIGLIEAPQRQGRVALLSDGRGGLMNGREGEIIEGRYRVLRVGTDSIDLAYTDGRGRQTIRLSGQ